MSNLQSHLSKGDILASDATLAGEPSLKERKRRHGFRSKKSFKERSHSPDPQEKPAGAIASKLKAKVSLRRKRGGKDEVGFGGPARVVFIVVAALQ